MKKKMTNIASSKTRNKHVFHALIPKIKIISQEKNFKKVAKSQKLLDKQFYTQIGKSILFFFIFFSFFAI